MIGALGEHDGLAARMVARNHHCHRCRVRTVLAEHCPVRMSNERSHLFSEVHHQAGRPRHRVPLLHAVDISGINIRLAVTEQVGTIATHEIDIAVAIGVPQIGAGRPIKELRVIIRQETNRLVAVHAARDHRLGPLSQILVNGIRPHGTLAHFMNDSFDYLTIYV